MTNSLSQKYFSVLSLGVRQHHNTSHIMMTGKKKLQIFMTMLRNSCIFCESRFSKNPQTNLKKTNTKVYMYYCDFFIEMEDN